MVSLLASAARGLRFTSKFQVTIGDREAGESGRKPEAPGAVHALHTALPLLSVDCMQRLACPSCFVSSGWITRHFLAMPLSVTESLNTESLWYWEILIYSRASGLRMEGKVNITFIPESA